VPTVSTYLTREVGPAERAEAFGRLYLFRGVVAFPSSTIGGLLYAWGGLRVPLIVNMLGVLIIMAILALFVHEPERNQEVVT
jgi:MFS family permease